MLPVNSWTNGQVSAGALVLSVARQITEHGTVTQPTAAPESGEAGITRSLIIGHDLWTVSDRGLMVNDLATLNPQAWIPQSIATAGRAQTTGTARLPRAPAVNGNPLIP